MTIELSDKARKEVLSAIDKEISFLEDNVYRHRHFGGFGYDAEAIVRDHDEAIAALKEAKQALTNPA